jgi:hypothetical protein
MIVSSYPGDECAVKAFNLANKIRTPYCSCPAKASDDHHSRDCAFWKHVLTARNAWCPTYTITDEFRVTAYGCHKEAQGGQLCKHWCGDENVCVASLEKV